MSRGNFPLSHGLLGSWSLGNFGAFEPGRQKASTAKPVVKAKAHPNTVTIGMLGCCYYDDDCYYSTTTTTTTTTTATTATTTTTTTETTTRTTTSTSNSSRRRSRRALSCPVYI